MIDKRLFYAFIAVLVIVCLRLLLEGDFTNLAIILSASIPFVQDLYHATKDDNNKVDKQ